VPDVSVIVPTYNRSRLACRAVESALAQTHTDIEVVVVDNHSSDSTWDAVRQIAERDQRIRAYRNDRNLGPVGNWRRGLELAESDFVQLLFSDDWLEPTAIEKLFEPIRQDDNIAFSYAAVQLHQAGEATSVTYSRDRASEFPSEDFLWDYATGQEVPVSPCGTLMRRDDALRALEDSPLPIPEGPVFYSRGIGLDALLLWRLCERYPHVFHTCDPLLNFEFDGFVDGQPGITAEMIKGGCGDVLTRGYHMSYGYFLATTSLPVRVRRRLATGWFIRRSRVRSVFSSRSWRSQLKSLSPRLNLAPRFADPKVVGLLYDRISEWFSSGSGRIF
jgi:glycosyltransferase involved in cell wall biosynthesis